MAAELELKPGWLERDTRRAAMTVACNELADALRNERQCNDALADAHSRVLAARNRVNRLKRDL